MSRWLVVVGFLVACGEFAPSFAEDRAAIPAQAEQPTGRPNREKLQQLRQRFGGGQLDLSKLKRVTWQVGDVTREALVYVPPGIDKTTHPPLIFAFHGHGGRAEYSVRKMGFHELWPEAVCVYPQGLPTPVPIIDAEGKFPGWQKYIGDQDDRDLAFFDAMLKSMQDDHHVDQHRIYCAGHSNGGYFTYVLCAARGDTFAAVAPIAATISLRDFPKQNPKPVLHVAGEQDRIVRFALQERSIEQLRKLNGCDADGKPAGELCTEYASKDGPPVVAFIHPGGHEIPEGAVKRITEFFQGHGKMK